MVFKEPCGVILGIAPWNAPIVSDPQSVQIKALILCADSRNQSIHHPIDMWQHSHSQGFGVESVHTVLDSGLISQSWPPSRSS
jgi:hypothetical protein